MGISKATFRLLLEEKKRGLLEGSLLQLGRQHTFLTYPELHSLASLHHTSLLPLSPTLSFNPDLKKQGFIDDITLFKSLGLSQVESLDYSDYESATHVHDFNLPLPDALYNHYDVVLDGGTLEHIFNLPQSLVNIHQLLKPNGIIIHNSPSHNHVDHGFYMFSPTLFYEYYKANKYHILTSYIYTYSPNLHTGPLKVYQYTPGSLNDFSFGGFGKQMVGILLIAQKTPESTCGVIPQQGSCQTDWHQTKTLPSPFKQQIKKIIPRPLLQPLLHLRSLLKRKMPTHLATY